jgi:hypothetical protein
MGIQSKNISNFHTQEENLCDGFDISSWEVSLYDNFCIFNLPKLASSLLRGWNSTNNNLLCEAFVTFNTDTGKIIESQCKEGIGDGNKHLETLVNMWNKQFDGAPSEYKFIFLMRNPTHKFISGIMEDTFVRTYGLSTFNECLTEFSTLYLNWKHNMIELGHSKTMLDEFKNDNVPINCKTSIKEKYLDIYRDTILMPFKEYIKSNTYHQPHTSIDIFFLHSLVLKSTKRTFSNSAIRIFDLDKENILQLLKELIGSVVDDQSKVDKDHYLHPDATNTRGDLPRLIFYEYIIHNTEVLNHIKKLVRLDEYCWFELINKLYPNHLYEKVMSDTISPYNHYKKRYYIKEDSDLNKLETYAQWQDHMSISIQAYLREN